MSSERTQQRTDARKRAAQELATYLYNNGQVSFVAVPASLTPDRTARSDFGGPAPQLERDLILEYLGAAMPGVNGHVDYTRQVISSKSHMVFGGSFGLENFPLPLDPVATLRTLDDLIERTQLAVIDTFGLDIVIERRVEEARKSAYAMGHLSGRTQGREEGRAEAQREIWQALKATPFIGEQVDNEVMEREDDY